MKRQVRRYTLTEHYRNTVVQTVDWRGILKQYLHFITRLHGLDHLGEGLPDHVDGISIREAEALAELRDEARKQWKQSKP